MANAAGPPAAAPTASAVGIKLPPFWPTKPAVWFAQVEAQFSIRNINQDATKYAYLVTALDDEISTRVCDILENPPADDLYDTLKQRLLDTFRLDESDRAAQVLDYGPLGADKPSQRMDAMLALVPAGETPGFLFKEVFLRQLPASVRPHLTSRDFADFRALARAADKLVGPESSAVDAIQKPSRRSSGRPTATTTSPPTVCWYHAKFGAAAAKCHQPCAFTLPVAENARAGRQ